jgi:tetratricopeptide (TPR) repeat protein
MKIKPIDLDEFEKNWFAEAGNAAGALRQARSQCPPIELIRASAEGLLEQDLQSAIADHISACPSCRDLQADLANLPPPSELTGQEADRILSRVLRGEEGETSRSRSSAALWWRISLVAAGLALCVALATWQVRKSSSVLSPGETRVAVNKTPEAPRTTALALQKPAVKFTLAVVTWRSAENSRDEFLKEIAPALDDYRADRFAEAAAQLSSLSTKYADSVEVWFYLGVSRLFQGEHAAAAEALEKAARLQDRSFGADISWYLGLSYAFAGRAGEAHALFSRLCQGQAEYKARACAAAQELASAPQPPR